ncbi:ABC transporter permease [Nesterenkonia alba]|uniref:ABC transporter permease n=1 Tax=Nesterenkonia alba TaxID=515814 RepID=UPI0003B7A911|nr:ABC transporter permease [Nesterenkonia alba]
MLRSMMERLGSVIITLLLASIVSFVILRAVPGDPARTVVGPLASDDAVAAVRQQLGLDDPLPVQYWNYITQFLSGDWGYSYSNGADVATVIAARMPATLELAFFAFLIAVIAALVIATVASYRRGVFGIVSKLLAIIGLGTPPFWLGLMLIIVFSLGLGLLPGPSGRLAGFLEPPPQITGFYTIDALFAGDFTAFSDALARLILPACALAVVPGAFLVRLLVANQSEVMQAPFVTVVRAKGVSRWITHLRHVVHNALLPTIGSAGVILATLITGSVMVETIYDWPGIGSTLVNGIQRQDFAVVQAFILLSAFLYVLANLAADLLLELVDPRLRVRAGGVRA